MCITNGDIITFGHRILSWFKPFVGTTGGKLVFIEDVRI